MPSATLLLREPSTTSLTSIVEKSQQKKPPFAEYDIRLSSTELDFVLVSSPTVPIKPPSPTDEGFESDIDTVSIVSSDDSFTTPTKQETDSANGSASSDSDTETIVARSFPSDKSNEVYNLVNCMCYTDIKFPDILVFVIKCEALVFRFDNLPTLRSFYTNFTTFKAIANQKTYHQNAGTTKFNLLQRTDRNGITHIEVTKELDFIKSKDDSQIISLNTPDFNNTSTAASNLHKESKLNFNSRQRSSSESPILDAKNSKGRSSSIENILDAQHHQQLSLLKKVWKSAEDLLEEAPKRPERRRKKQKAPDPPQPQPQPNVLTGQYVRVNVITQEPVKRFHLKNIFPQTYSTLNPKKELFQQFKRAPPENWTYSVPRFLRRPRSQSETRNLRLDYGFVDYTQGVEKHGVTNRLFGMSSKLKDFTAGTIGRRYDWDSRYEIRRGSLGELSYKIDNGAGVGGSLKSVIKKDDHKRKNDKKVTFSAYTTVQVV